MGHYLTYEEVGGLFATLNQKFRLIGPCLKKGMGRFSDTDVIGYGDLKSFDDLVLDQKSEFSPKEVVFPSRETLFVWHGNEGKVPEQDEQDVIVFLRPCDIHGLDRLDQIFLKNGSYADPYYERRRKKLHTVMIECTQGFDSCFCVSMGTNVCHGYDMAIRPVEGGLLFHVKNTRLEEHISASVMKTDSTGDCDSSSIADFIPEFITANKITVKVPEVGTLNTSHFDHPVWKEYTERCIHCGRCNTSCVTCSCFTMQDVLHTPDAEDTVTGERRRRWAGCHVNGFTDMAGGHAFRKKDGERMRFKAMHKVNDFAKRFGGPHMCVGCGRCDDVCPEYISFSKCINKLNDIVEEERKGVADHA